MSIAIVISVAALVIPFMAVFFWKMCVEQRHSRLCRVVKLGADPLKLDPSFPEERFAPSSIQGKVIPIATRSPVRSSHDAQQIGQYANSQNAARRMWK